MSRGPNHDGMRRLVIMSDPNNASGLVEDLDAHGENAIDGCKSTPDRPSQPWRRADSLEYTRQWLMRWLLAARRERLN